MTGYWNTKFWQPTVAGQVWYTTPTPLLYDIRINWNDKPLGISSLINLDNAWPNWEGQVAGQSGIPSYPSKWAPAGLQRFAIWPADAYSNNSLMIDGTADTPILINPTDTIDIGPSALTALSGYALHVVSFKSGATVLKKTQPFYDQFMAAAADENGILNMSSEFRMAMGLDLSRGEVPLRPFPKQSPLDKLKAPK